MANLGAIGIHRPLRVRYLTGTQSPPNGLTRLGLPANLIRYPAYTPIWPSEYWNCPCVMGDQRGQLYWAQGSNSLIEVALETQDPDAGNGWRWYRPGVQRLYWPVSQGANTLAVRVNQSTAAEPHATLRILANAAIGIQETIASASGGAYEDQTITITLNARYAGIVTLQLEHLNWTANARVDWLDLTVSR